jgi:hypothetical protein
MRRGALSRLRLGLTVIAALVLSAIPAAGLVTPAVAAGTGSISGTVTVPAGVDVTSIRVEANNSDIHASSPGWVTPAVNGNFTFNFLDQGAYYVSFSYGGGPVSPIISTSYTGGPSLSTPVSVSAGSAVTGINETLKPAAIVSGTVSVPAGSPVFEGTVLVSAGPDFAGNSVYGNFITRSDNGQFSIGGLKSGNYKLQYLPTSNSPWAKMWHGGVGGHAASPAVVLTEGARVTGVNDQAVAGASIEGLVSGGAAQNLVTVVDAAGNEATTGALNGAPYAFRNLFPGTYTVGFNRASGSSTTMEAQYYNNLPEAAGIGAANRVTAAPGGQVTNINATTRAGATLSGKVLTAEGTPLTNSQVRVYTKDGSLVTRGGTTDGDGNFTVTGLTTGKYLVAANMIASHPSGALGPIYSGNARTESGATAVSTVVGENTDIGTLSYGTVTGGTPVFTDVPAGSQFAAEITWLAEKGISTGWTENGITTYRSLQPVNRDAMAAFMYRLAGKPAFTEPAVSPFIDLPVGTQFYKEITWLAAQGISTGWDEPGNTKSYRPLQPVNRDAMAAFMYRLAGKPAFTEPATSPFTDVSGSTQFYKEITWLAAQNISTGWDEPGNTKSYRPFQPVNRDAMAAFMYRYNTKFGSI